MNEYEEQAEFNRAYDNLMNEQQRACGRNCFYVGFALMMLSIVIIAGAWVALAIFV